MFSSCSLDSSSTTPWAPHTETIAVDDDLELDDVEPDYIQIDDSSDEGSDHSSGESSEESSDDTIGTEIEVDGESDKEEVSQEWADEASTDEEDYIITDGRPDPLNPRTALMWLT